MAATYKIGVGLLCSFLLCAIVTSSCGVSALESTPEPVVVAQDESGAEDSFCNCHLKAELDTVAVAAWLPLEEDEELVVAQVVSPPFAHALRPASAVSLPDRPPSYTAERDWPVPLARAHL